MDDRELMVLHMDTCIRCDPNGRLRYVNEPGDAYDPPRFLMGRTTSGNFWRFRYDLPLDLVRELDAVCAAEPIASDLRAVPHTRAAVRALLERHAPPGEEYRGPAYWIPDTHTSPAEVVAITGANASVLQTGFPWYLPWAPSFDTGPFIATVVEGQAVSICYCSRLADKAAEAGVDTLEAFRGRGYAALAVAGWAVAVRTRGLLPMYSTSWDNLASQGVARKLGMIPYGEDWSIE
jgi:hypothetical protein